MQKLLSFIRSQLFIFVFIFITLADVSRWNYLQGRNGDTDVENRYMDRGWEGEGGTNWKTGIDIYMLLLLTQFSRVRLCATPQTAAHQALLSLRFSRQEHWSGLPFPSPMHEKEKGKWSWSVMSDSLRPHGLQPTRLLRPWDFAGKSTGVRFHHLLQPNFSSQSFSTLDISNETEYIYSIQIF